MPGPVEARRTLIYSESDRESLEGFPPKEVKIRFPFSKKKKNHTSCSKESGLQGAQDDQGQLGRCFCARQTLLPRQLRDAIDGV